jgi:hypothetical protein
MRRDPLEHVLVARDLDRLPCAAYAEGRHAQGLGPQKGAASAHPFLARLD